MSEYEVILDLPDAELYAIISKLRTAAINKRSTVTDDEEKEDCDCTVAGLDQMAYELQVTGDILGEDREWLQSLLNSYYSTKVKQLEDIAFQKITVTPLFTNVCLILDWVSEGIRQGTVTPAMEERLQNVEDLLEGMVA